MSTAVDDQLDENPLVEGLERLPVHPTALVIFGATGDLAHRKLLPAIYNLAHEGALPERFELIGVARREKEHEDFAEMAKESIERFSRQKPDSDVLNGLLQDVRYLPGTFDDDKVYSELERVLGGVRREGGPPPQPDLLPDHRAGFLSRDRRENRRGRSGPAGAERGPNRDREALRGRSGLSAQAQRRSPGGLSGVADLPDRPLPGQGDRPEPDGVPVRQHAVRAGVEPQLHRQRSDHRG